jgi:signal transduction histidine kinase
MMTQFGFGRGTLAQKRPLSRLSFRWQITLLGALAAVLVVAVLIAALAASRYTKSAMLSDEKRDLSSAAYSLAHEYSNNIQTSEQNREVPPLENPDAQSSQQVLTLLTRMALQNTDGVEGGFYSTAGDSVLGYVPATHGAYGEGITIPADEQEAILEVSRAAALKRQQTDTLLTGLPDIVLVEAVPVGTDQDHSGSAWVLKRLPTLPGSNRFRTYLIAVGLGGAALACVLLTLLVVRNLQSGVRKIESGLESLERNLSSQIPTGTDPDEIDRIAQAVNRLAATLKENIEREQQIEGQLQHSERLAALGRLVAGVAHEVRNPLATIRLRIQMCQREANHLAVQESCAIALEEVERLNGIVSRLLTFAQPVHLRRESVRLSRLVQQRLESFRDKARQHSVRFITNFRAEEAALPIDRDRMAQVFDNIIQNAIESMPAPGGTLWVSVSSGEESAEQGEAVYVEFRDTGTGIHPNVAGRVFDPFFTTKASGTGLGLSICRELVTAHGGEIRLESSEGCGTNVRIILPLRRAPVTIPLRRQASL